MGYVSMQGNLPNENYEGHNKLTHKFQNSWGIEFFIGLG